MQKKRKGNNTQRVFIKSRFHLPLPGAENEGAEGAKGAGREGEPRLGERASLGLRETRHGGARALARKHTAANLSLGAVPPLEVRIHVSEANAQMEETMKHHVGGAVWFFGRN